MCGSVGIPTGDRGSRLGDTLFRTNDMNYALLAGGNVKIGDSKLRTILAEFLNHFIGKRI